MTMDWRNERTRLYALQHLAFELIPSRSGAESKVILTVFRHTLGFGKVRAYILRSQLKQKGCQSTQLTDAIDLLYKDKIIRIFNKDNAELNSKERREYEGHRIKSKLKTGDAFYYEFHPELLQKMGQWIVKESRKVKQYSPSKRDTTVSESVSINSNKYQSINNNSIKGKGGYQRNFIIKRVKLLLPSLSESDILTLINRFQDKDVISASEKVKTAVEQGMQVRSFSAFLSSRIQEEPHQEFSALREIIKKHIKSSYYTETPQQAVANIMDGETSVDVSIRIARNASNASLDTTRSVVCDNCAGVGISLSMFLFSYRYRNEQILCSKCSKPDEFIKEILKKQNA